MIIALALWGCQTSKTSLEDTRSSELTEDTASGNNASIGFIL